MMDKRKLFLTAADVAEDLDTDLQDAERIVKELNARVVQKGGMYVKGKVAAAFYQKMKNTGFTSTEGKPEPDRKSLTEKRLLNIEEFCFYSGMQRKLANKFAKEIGIGKRIGRRMLYDRELFDRWCDNNREAMQASVTTNNKNIPSK